MHRATVFLSAVATVGALAAADAQHPPDIVGTWRLVSASAIGPTGARDDAPFGRTPHGILIYTPERTMAALVSYDRRPPLSADRIAAPAEERAAAFATFFSYAGTYTLRRDTVVHHVSIASVQNWVGTDLVRVVALSHDRLVLRTPVLSVGGVLMTSELVWQRVGAPAG